MIKPLIVCPLVQEEGEGHLVMAALSCDQTPNCVSTCAGGGRGSPGDGCTEL